MVACVTIAKLLGLIYIFPLTRLIGDAGIGIYANAYNLYAILLTLSTAGFPTAMGKVIAERLALRQYREVEEVYRTTLRTVFCLGAALFVVMWFGAPVYSRLVALKAPGASAQSLVWSVRAVAPCLLLVPVMSALRGYLQGFQRLEPSAYSQAIEQLVRVVAIVAGAAWIMQRTHGNVAAGAAAATFGAVAGAAAGLLWLWAAVWPLRREFKHRMLRSRFRPRRRSGAFRALAAVALPVSLGALVVPFSGVVDSLTVQNLLLWGGASLTEAEARYGVLSRQAFQLIQLPLAFAMAVGASVLPAIASAVASRDGAAVARHTAGTLRSMFLITVPVAAALLVLAQPLDLVLFGKTEGAPIIASVSFMGIFSSLELTSTYMLQGLGQMYRPVRNMFLGIFVKLLLNFALIIPFGIMGAAVSSTVGYLFSSTLNVLAVKKYGQLRLSVLRLAGPFIVSGVILAGVMGGVRAGVTAGLARFGHPAGLWAAVCELLAALATGGAVYLFTVIRMRAVTAAELARLPAVGGRLSRLAARWQAR